MDSGYFIAQRLPDGSPGRPVGNNLFADQLPDNGSIMMFDDLGKANVVRRLVEEELGQPLSLFKMNMAFAGVVVE